MCSLCDCNNIVGNPATVGCQGYYRISIAGLYGSIVHIEVLSGP